MSLWIPFLLIRESYTFICWLIKYVYVYIIVNIVMSCVIKLQYTVLFSLCFFLLSKLFIVNTTTSCVVKLHRQYVLFSVVSWFVGVIEKQGRFFPKGEGSVTTLVKNPYNKK